MMTVSFDFVGVIWLLLGMAVLACAVCSTVYSVRASRELLDMVKKYKERMERNG